MVISRRSGSHFPLALAPAHLSHRSIRVVFRRGRFAALCHILLPRTRCFDHKRDDTDFNPCCWVYGGLTDRPSVPCDAHHARPELRARLWQTSTTPRSTTDDGMTHTPTRCLMPQRYLSTCVRHGWCVNDRPLNVDAYVPLIATTFLDNLSDSWYIPHSRVEEKSCWLLKQRQHASCALSCTRLAFANRATGELLTDQYALNEACSTRSRTRRARCDA